LLLIYHKFRILTNFLVFSTPAYEKRGFEIPSVYMYKCASQKHLNGWVVLNDIQECIYPKLVSNVYENSSCKNVGPLDGSLNT
jgi:hypothetical protein